MVYFIADTHFGGDNILKYENRPFKDTNEMDNTIIDNWNNAIKEDDTVFMVGDFFDKKDNEYIKNILSKLKGKINLIIGNHDKGYEELYKKLGLTVYEYPIIFENFWMISHEPLYMNNQMPYANIYGHVHANPNYKDYSNHGYCISVERINYTPISFEEIKNKVINYK